MDAIVRVQLAPEREGSAQEYATKLRDGLRTGEKRFADLEFSFNTGGLIRGAMNEGKSTPVTIRVTGKDLAKPAQIAALIREQVARVDGVVDAVIVQRQNYPEYVINVDRTKAADLGMTQIDVMQNVVAALNSSISFNKRNFWIDPVAQPVLRRRPVPREGHHVGRDDARHPDHRPAQGRSRAAPDLATITRTTVPTEITHNNLAPSVDLTLGVDGRDLGHVADDITLVARTTSAQDPRAGGVYDPYLSVTRRPTGSR